MTHTKKARRIETRSISKAFAPLSLSPAQASKLETLMQQQVQDALLAHSAQRATQHKLDPDWRFAGSLGQLKAFKSRGLDSFNSSSSWPSLRDPAACSTPQEHALSLTSTMTTSGAWSTRSRSTERAGLSSSSSRRDPLNDASPGLQSFRIFGRIQGNYRDVLDVHHTSTTDDFVRQQKLMFPSVLDAAVLHTMRATKDSYLGIKWQAEHAFGGKRDVCFVEMVGYTLDEDGHEVAFVAMASVNVPECPPVAKFTRVRMKRTMLVRSAPDAPHATSEVFVMGTSDATESSLATLAQHRLTMAVLSDLSLVIDSKNIAQMRLVHEQHWVPDATRPCCSICNRKFQFLYRRRHHCRLCGDIVCKTCYVTRAVAHAERKAPSTSTVICQTKFCVRCVMSLRAMDRWIVSKRMSRKATIESSASGAEGSPTFHASVTYFKRGTNEKQTLDLDRLYEFAAPEDEGEPETAAADVSYACLRSSQSFNHADFRAYKLGELTRHGSHTSLCSEPISLYEEKVILKLDKFRRIVAM